jgi:hypothetical protein
MFGRLVAGRGRSPGHDAPAGLGPGALMLGSVAACRWHSGGLLQLIAVARYVTKVVLLMVLARVVGWWTQDSSSSDAALVTARSTLTEHK